MAADSDPRTRALIWRRVALLLFVSGFCSLVYQVTWLRLLRLVFGVSTASTAAVLAIFMGGLGLGGYLCGRRLRRIANPMAFYARLELGIALLAAASPFLVAGARSLYLSLGGAQSLGPWAATGVRLALATLVLGGATTLMGGTLPAVAQAMNDGRDPGRRDLGWLYGINTLGAVVGAVATTFFFIEILGVRQTLWLASLVNLLVALGVRDLARWPELARPSGAGEATPTEGERASTSDPKTRRLMWVVLPMAGATGFLFFAMELVWYRMLAPILGGSSYTFGLILATALLGIGLGGLLYAWEPRRRPPSLSWLGLTCLVEALALGIPLALGDSVALLAAALRPLSALGFGGLLVGWSAITGLVVLPASVVAGYQFPLMVALLRRSRGQVGWEVGLAYAWNTWGAILGSLAGGFGLLPLVGAVRLWWLGALVLLLLGVGIVVLARRWEDECEPADERWPSRGRRTLPWALAILVLATLASEGPSAYWRHSPIGIGRAKLDFEGANELRQRLRAQRGGVLEAREGVESSIALTVGDDLGLIVNGKSDGTARGDAPTQVMGGLVGALLHPDPTSALVIGMGTGTTAGWLAQVPSIERVDVVELEPAVVELADRFATVNEDLLASPKTEVLLGDGREIVLTRENRYSVVFSEPSNPYRAGVADLFSQEFYAGVLGTLESDGVFLQWLQAYEVDAELVQTVVATLRSVFPYLEIWQIHTADLLLVGSPRPLDHDLARVARRLDQEPYDRALAEAWGVVGVEGFYSGFVAGDRLAQELLAGLDGEVSTDDRPVVEFGFVRGVRRRKGFAISHLIRVAESTGQTQAPVHSGQLDPEKLLEQTLTRAIFELGASPGLEKMRALGDDARHRLLARQAYVAGQLGEAGHWWSQQSQAPTNPVDHLLLVESTIASATSEPSEPMAEEEIANLLRTLEPFAETEAEALRARWAWQRGDVATALDHLERTFAHCRQDGWFYRPLIRRTLAWVEIVVRQAPEAAPRLFEVLSEPFAAHLLDESRRRFLVPLASHPEPREQCIEAFANFEPFVPWERSLLEARRNCYRAMDHPLAAVADRELLRFEAASPPTWRLLTD